MRKMKKQNGKYKIPSFLGFCYYAKSSTKYKRESKKTLIYMEKVESDKGYL